MGVRVDVVVEVVLDKVVDVVFSVAVVSVVADVVVDLVDVEVVGVVVEESHSKFSQGQSALIKNINNRSLAVTLTRRHCSYTMALPLIAFFAKTPLVYYLRKVVNYCISYYKVNLL